jgi:preprotein translocase subunit SecA
VIADAGETGAVTIATNMAGRGTDIKLGPNVREAGGLHVIGTERHESRRIDNQLRGRSGRQGDPGSSRFYVSFGDDIMKRFAPEWVPGMMQKLGMTEELPLESRMVQRAMEQAQQKVEGHNFDIRKRLVEFDDVINEHRKVIYAERERILSGVDTRENVLGMVLDELETICESDAEPEVFLNEVREILPDDTPSLEELEELGDDADDEILTRAEEKYESFETAVGAENMRRVEHWLLLESIDFHWREHLTAIDDLRQSIGLQAYAQVDPLVAFKREGYDMYQQLQANIRKQVARTVFKVKVEQKPAPIPGRNGGAEAATSPAPAGGASVAATTNGAAATVATPVLAGRASPAPAALRTNRGDGAAPAATATPGGQRTGAAAAPKIGRNDPCHCGSGKKFKRCHGAL